MVTPELLALLRCPEDHSKLVLADEALIARLNETIAAGRLKTRGGQTLEKKLDGGLVRADGRMVYPIIDKIPILLVDEAIPIEDQ